MTLKEFTELLGIHGSDLRKWPHDRRLAAIGLLERSKAAKAAHAEASSLDAALCGAEAELGPAQRESLIEGIMTSLDDQEPTAGAKETPSDRAGKSGASEALEDGTGSARTGRGLRMTDLSTSDSLLILPGRFPSFALPGILVQMAFLMLGILIGLAVTYMSNAPRSISAVYGGVELWVK